MTHAFFKALLFLGSGSVIHGMHHEQDMRKMGNLRKYLPITFITMMAGWLAICGIPVFAGFFSKDEILYRTFATGASASEATLFGIHVNLILWVIGLITAVMTAVYMTRMMWMTFYGSERFHGADDVRAYASTENGAETAGLGEDDDDDDDEDEVHHHLPHDFVPRESPWTMTVPLIILAFLSTVGGLAGIPYAMSSIFGMGDVNVFEHILEPVIAKKGEHKEAESGSGASKTAHSESSAATKETVLVKSEEHPEHSAEEVSTERWLAGLSILLALSGIVIGWTAFGKTPLREMPRLLANKWYVDEIYNKFIVDPIAKFSAEGLWKGFDLGVIDGMLHGIAQFVTALGSLARLLQVGFVRSYAAFILFGALIILGYFIYYGFKLVG